MFMALVHCVLSCANQILNLCHSNHIKGAGGQGYSCYGYLGFIIRSNEVYVTVQRSCNLASLIPIFHTPVCRREAWQRDLLNGEMVGYYGYLGSNEVRC